MLKISDYAKYISYDLQVQFQRKDYNVYAIDKDGEIHLDTAEFGYGTVIKAHIKPYLRPISQMAEEITHNGKTIVPIVELAKLANTGSEKYVCDFSKDFGLVNCTLICEKYFSFIFYHNVFYLENKKGENVICTEQPKFFEKLYEWHFWLSDQSYFDKGLILKLEN